MKLRQALINLITPPDPAQDLREARWDLTLALTEQCSLRGYQVLGLRQSVDGPMGGESARFDVEDQDGNRFMVSVYARGLFAADNDRIREVLARNNRYDREDLDG